MRRLHCKLNVFTIYLTSNRHSRNEAIFNMRMQTPFSSPANWNLGFQPFALHSSVKSRKFCVNLINKLSTKTFLDYPFLKFVIWVAQRSFFLPGGTSLLSNSCRTETQQQHEKMSYSPLIMLLKPLDVFCTSVHSLVFSLSRAMMVATRMVRIKIFSEHSI